MGELRRYAYCYAIIDDVDTGLCMGVDDTTSYILDRTRVPVPEYSYDYAFKYYWPLPTTVTSHSDFQGKWYDDEEHTILSEGLN